MSKKQDFFGDFRSHFSYYGNTVVYYLWDKELVRYFKGSAVCQDGDTYNKEFGEKLARLKAVYKMRQYKAGKYQQWLDAFEESTKYVDEVRNQLKYYTEKSQEAFGLINDLIGQ